VVDEEPAAPLMYLEKFFYGTNYYFILIVPKGSFRKKGGETKRIVRNVLVFPARVGWIKF